MRKVINGILSAMEAAAMLLFLAFLLAHALGCRFYIVQSGSMEPAIHTGSICVVNTRAAYADIRKGDVIAFQRGGMRVTHRVQKITKEGIITKGDANDVSDGLMAEKDYIGKTVFSIPALGYVTVFLGTLMGCLAAAAVLLLLCFIILQGEIVR